MRAWAKTPPRLWGLWQRTLYRARGGPSDRTTRVFYLQTPRLFADIRVPATRPSFSHRAALTDLRPDERLALARQRAFAGHATVKGSRVSWHHAFDYQPYGGVLASGDEGEVAFQGARMIEQGVHADYVEHYLRLDGGKGPYLALHAPAEGASPEGLVVVAGDHFIYARNRRARIPGFGNLADMLRRARDPLALLDAEFSYGRRRGGRVPWEVLLSTIPMREGRRRFASGAFRSRAGRPGVDRIMVGDPAVQRFTIVDSTLPGGELDAFLNARDAAADA